VEAVLPDVLRWFGPDSERTALAVEHGVMDAAGSALRARFVERVSPVLDDVGGIAITAAQQQLDFTGFDESTRRVSQGGPDAETIEKVRGDKNRAFLMD
jgi:hypothetical protein